MRGGVVDGIRPVADGTEVLIPGAFSAMIRARRLVSFVGALLIVAALLPVAATPVAAAGATVPAGFADETVWADLDHPMAIAFAPDGKIFVAEKRGTIRVYDSLSDQTPTIFADLSVERRQLLGPRDDGARRSTRTTRRATRTSTSCTRTTTSSATRPGHRAGRRAASTRGTRSARTRRSGRPTAASSPGRLSRLQSNLAANPAMTGSEDVLIEDWCQQFPSHSQGALMFGPEGALYVSGGDGASFNSGAPDYGQLGGSLPGTPTPVNPCDDPPGGIDGSMTPPSAEGGALRSQDIRTSGDPTGLDGTILRVDPDTGDAWPTQRQHRQQRRQRPPDHRVRPAQPVPVHDQARHGRRLAR